MSRLPVSVMSLQPMRRAGRPQNVGARLLTEEENEKLLKCFPRKSVAQASAVVQIYETSSSLNSWTKKCSGVACFIKDNVKRAFFIRVYDIWDMKLIWEHKIYHNFKYETLSCFFHYFPSDDFWVGINFDSEGEANDFKRVIEECLLRRAERRKQRRQKLTALWHTGTSSRCVSTPEHSTYPPTSGCIPTVSSKSNTRRCGTLRKAANQGGSNFVRISHVGWDPTKNWQVGEEDELKRWCKALGIDEDLLNDLETMNFIKDFVKTHGGMEAVKREMSHFSSVKARKGGRSSLPRPSTSNRDQERGPAVPLSPASKRLSWPLPLSDMQRPPAPDDHPSMKIMELLMGKHGLSRAEVNTVFALREEYELSGCIEAVKAVGANLQRARDYFKQCDICFTSFVVDEMVSIPACQCHVCIECFREHFTHLIRTTSLMYRYSCPACDEPDLEKCEEGAFQTYFLLLGGMMKIYLQKKDYELYEQKLTTWSLVADPNFRWCANGCGAGFINERRQKKIQCPSCKKHQCFHCNQPWLNQHNNISCEEFDVWKKGRDPEMQGLVSHLKENGIDCPKCKMRYELAKGGCMHFKCTQCHHEFCCGCNLPFLSNPACNQFQPCKVKGLHAHHPRDCFYYLRDEKCDVLQQLLRKHMVDYHQRTNAAANGGRPQGCPVKEQQETPDRLVDAVCGKPLKDQCGSCENHYKEYLVGLINRHNIDPVEILDVDNLKATLRRNGKQIPNQNGNETDAAYCARLRQEVHQQLPLRQRNAKINHGIAQTL